MEFGDNIAVCKVCKFPSLVKFISFGKMPAANAFLKENELDKEEFKYDMEVGFCKNCKMVQLVNLIPYDKYIVPDETGKTNYAYFSSTSSVMEKHFAQLAGEVELRFLEPNSKVMDIGSNDGIMLKAFKSNKVLGVEPSNNVAEVARLKGIETITDFFTEYLADRILREKGKFKAILSTNVFLNVIDIHSFMRGVVKLLEDKGVFITEDPYIPDILEKTSYDQVYDEHIWYFSIASLNNLYSMYGMELFDAEHQEVHGGSMRYYACRKGAYPKTARLKEYIEKEKQLGIETIEPYKKFSDRVTQSKYELKSLLNNLKSQGKKIVGYGAASKGTIVLNYCDIGKETLDYISDSTPFKQGLYSPGKKIPIVPPEFFHKDNADYALLSAWNHADEIIGKEKAFLERGGKFIVHYPKARILEPKTKQGAVEQKITSETEEDVFKDVKIKPLKIWANDQGYLFETIRADDEIFDGKFGQNLVSVIYPGVIKGLHLHEKQTDYTTCVKGNLKYVVAKETPSGVKTKVIIIGESNPVLVKTPPGFWHGYMPLGNEKAIVMHMMDKAFDVKEPDTQRKDVFEFGDVWTVKPS
ncbi:MAG: methyltransferase domain-containing protein [Candidatus Pacearchaeota archaeon]